MVLLTAIGEGVQRFVVKEFTQFGTNLIAISPGKTETFGMSGAMISNVRPLSLDDAEALTPPAAGQAVVPFIQGNAEVEADGKTRRTTVFGTGPRSPRCGRSARHWAFPARRRTAPGARLCRCWAASCAVSCSAVRRSASASAIGGETYRIVGTMQPRGQMLGFDLDDTVYIPDRSGDGDVRPREPDGGGRAVRPRTPMPTSWRRKLKANVWLPSRHETSPSSPRTRCWRCSVRARCPDAGGGCSAPSRCWSAVSGY